MIDCPICRFSFQSSDLNQIVGNYPYTCPRCGEEFYSYNQLRTMSPKKLKEAYVELKEKKYFERVYNYLEEPLWQEMMEIEKHRTFEEELKRWEDPSLREGLWRDLFFLAYDYIKEKGVLQGFLRKITNEDRRRLGLKTLEGEGRE